MSSKLTIRDIARLAGVSTATVSRVLNSKPDVDPETRQRVLRIVEEHRYVPSFTASSLAGGRSRLLGALTPSLTWPLMPPIMQGIAEVIEQTDYELVLYSVSHRTDRSALIDRIIEARLIDGLIAVYPDGVARVPESKSASASDGEPRDDRTASNHLRDLYQQGFPIVILDDQSLPGPTPWVGPDNRIGAFEAVRHLVRLGHRRIAHIQGPAEYQCSHDRLLGYKQALNEAGIAYDPALVVEGDFTVPGGHTAASELLHLPVRPTAIFAANDQMAYGTLSAARIQGLQTPDDLAVIGFDDTALSAHIRPALTTVRQPFDAMGKSAAELLLTLMTAPHPFGANWYARVPQVARARFGQETLKAMQAQLPTELVVRESCGAQLHPEVVGASDAHLAANGDGPDLRLHVEQRGAGASPTQPR